MSDSEEFEKKRFEAFYAAWLFGSHYSDSTHRRWRKLHGIVNSQALEHEKFYRHAKITVELMLAEIERCFEGKAHFAVGLLSTCLIELQLQLMLLAFEKELKTTDTYAKMREKSSYAKSLRPSFVKVISSLQFADLVKLARKCKFLEQVHLSEQVLDVLTSSKYPCDINGALKFLQDR
jgi:hypothetical protein